MERARAAWGLPRLGGKGFIVRGLVETLGTRESGLRCLVLGVVPLLLVAACSVATVPEAKHPPQAEALPPDVARRFDYLEHGAPLTSWTCTLVHDESRYVVYKVDGQVTLRGDNHPVSVEAEFWRTKEAGPRAPAVVITPILGGGNDIARLIAREFAEAGMHGMIVWRGVKVLAPEWSEEEIDYNLRRGIVARRRVIDWLEQRPEVDPRRIAAFGISMGGICTAVLAPVEPRIHSAVIALAGGDLASVVMNSDERRLVEFKVAKMRDEKISAADLEKKLRAALVDDPAELGRYADADRFLMFIARHDTTVPTANQLWLRHKLGNPRAFDMPTSHYSTMAYTPFVRAQSTSWLLERMKEPNPRVPEAGER
jgi:dienelactone hydrolase